VLSALTPLYFSCVFDLTALLPLYRQQLLTLPLPCSCRDLTYWEPMRLNTHPHAEKGTQKQAHVHSTMHTSSHTITNAQ